MISVKSQFDFALNSILVKPVVPFHTGNIPFYSSRNKSTIKSSTTSLPPQAVQFQLKH